jgi:hypothetical protein
MAKLKFVLEIDCSNRSFQLAGRYNIQICAEEVASILTKVAKDLRSGGFYLNYRNLFDSDGVQVGRATFHE